MDITLFMTIIDEDTKKKLTPKEREYLKNGTSTQSSLPDQTLQENSNKSFVPSEELS